MLGTHDTQQEAVTTLSTKAVTNLKTTKGHHDNSLNIGLKWPDVSLPMQMCLYHDVYSACQVGCIMMQGVHPRPLADAHMKS